MTTISNAQRARDNVVCHAHIHVLCNINTAKIKAFSIKSK